MAKRSENGSTLTEVVVVAGILALVSLAFLGSFGSLSRYHEKNQLVVKGELLAEEGVEALRLLRSNGWSTLSSLAPGNTYYLSVGSGSFSITGTSEIIDGDFYRSFRVYSVSRDASDDIVTSGGTLDPGTLLVDVSVSWNWRNATSTANYKAYFTNI